MRIAPLNAARTAQRTVPCYRGGLHIRRGTEITCGRLALHLDNWSRLSRKTSLERIKTA